MIISTFLFVFEINNFNLEFLGSMYTPKLNYGVMFLSVFCFDSITM